MIIIKSYKPIKIYKNTLHRLLLQFRITMRKQKRQKKKLCNISRLLFWKYKISKQRKNSPQIRMGGGISKVHRNKYIINYNKNFLYINNNYFFLCYIFFKKLKHSFNFIYLFYK